MTQLELYNAAIQSYDFGEEPLMTDKEFDQLERELLESGEITTRHAADITKVDGEKKPLVYPMLSIQTTTISDYDKESFDDFIKSRFPGQELFSASAKIDGASFQAVYSEGKLVHALTRGDRQNGFVITKQLAHLLPQTINYSEVVAIIGEAYIDKATFTENLAGTYKNERNAVGGLYNATKDQAKWDLFKYIDIKIFKIVYADGTIELASEELLSTDVSESIADKANAQTSLLRSDIYDFFDTFMQSRAALPYRIDGLVITPVDSSHTTMHNGLYADYVALKHVEKTAITTIDWIEFRLRNNGKLFPLAHLTPVELDGTTVQKASIFNYRNMLKQGLFPGAVVEVTKGGDIIPDIYSVIEPAEPTEEWLIENDIANCDYNGVDLISKADTSMKRFISGIHMLNLDNVGHSIAVELFNAGYTSILDLFNFDESKLFHKYKENSKTLNNIKAQISKRFESINLQHLIKALRVNGIGDKSACNIADYIILGKAADDVNYNVYERHFIESEEFDILLEVLDTYDSRIDRTQYWRTPKLQELPKTAILVRYCLTGSPKNFGFSKKSEFVNKLNRHNFQFEETDVKNCEYLICDDVNSNSSKTKTAKSLLKKIVTYDKFLNIYELNK